ncbi:MAG: phenylalanine--tRNA ligase subunit alpha [Gemmatimonadota bacterium]|jgi:phenylalanyl-tRNA synthetase alpha chain|nr:phenylalanine--tRNA ligase subunit alpha [Gemmatimonadota bacterium]MDP6461023.1 phenylalanine--tRNA ligase subunit alpha [Gemmatimonadota bacterium]MDP6529994.1 phenylalanine--tRNA ligase subunit alpha [Gemmatimonadota bacterium]MDP6802101.1 phenylalanine--tRNA ligase subunit alpha [Gemmatimonadota bacterium]MDP7032641.1 phenylalanine--tRNA ligase subunit alpha [Gemmatimonadota bacterium]
MAESPAEVLERALREVGACTDQEALNDVKVRFLGRKGEVTAGLRSIPSLPVAQRPSAGQEWNRLRTALAEALDARGAELADTGGQSDGSSFDPTLPGRRPPLGVPHVLAATLDELVGAFRSMGFSVADGPEVETERYNFEMLNIPEGHPTRDDQDSIFLGGGLLLRTQMSPVQIRVMEKHSPPVRIVSPGRVYRRDTFDASHSPFFFQMEGLYVDEDVTLGDLKGTLRAFAHSFFEEGIGLRFRGSYFPFTEPSLEMDIACTVCEGAGCPVCKSSGWVEVLGCGMVHPRVLRGVGYDPDVVSGFAFGLGVDRIAMLRHRIPDIRLFYDNDLRFLHQFGGAS